MSINYVTRYPERETRAHLSIFKLRKKECCERELEFLLNTNLERERERGKKGNRKKKEKLGDCGNCTVVHETLRNFNIDPCRAVPPMIYIISRV